MSPQDFLLQDPQPTPRLSRLRTGTTAPAFSLTPRAAGLKEGEAAPLLRADTARGKKVGPRAQGKVPMGFYQRNGPRPKPRCGFECWGGPGDPPSQASQKESLCPPSTQDPRCSPGKPISSDHPQLSLADELRLTFFFAISEQQPMWAGKAAVLPKARGRGLPTWCRQPGELGWPGWPSACTGNGWAARSLQGQLPAGQGGVLGGNSGHCCSDEDNKAFEVWQQLLVAGAGSQLVHRALRQPESPHHSLWMGKLGPRAERTY